MAASLLIYDADGRLYPKVVRLTLDTFESQNEREYQAFRAGFKAWMEEFNPHLFARRMITFNAE